MQLEGLAPSKGPSTWPKTINAIGGRFALPWTHLPEIWFFGAKSELA
jgi:hypothetical protein